MGDSISSDVSVLGLLRQYADVMRALRSLGVLRSGNNPVADYAEHLVSVALGLTLERGSTTGFDATAEDGTRYEIKGRRPTRENQSRQLSVFRGLDEGHFDVLAGVLFNEDFTVQRACLVPIETVRALADYREHVNAWILQLRDSVWEQPEVTDITAELRAEQIG